MHVRELEPQPIWWVRFLVRGISAMQVVECSEHLSDAGIAGELDERFRAICHLFGKPVPRCLSASEVTDRSIEFLLIARERLVFADWIGPPSVLVSVLSQWGIQRLNARATTRPLRFSVLHRP